MNPITTGRSDASGIVLVLLDRTVEWRREQRLALLARAAAGLLTGEDPDLFLGDCLAEGGPLIGFDHAYSYVIAPSGQHLQLKVSIGLTEAERVFFANALPRDHLRRRHRGRAGPGDQRSTGQRQSPLPAGLDHRTDRLRRVPGHGRRAPLRRAVVRLDKAEVLRR